MKYVIPFIVALLIVGCSGRNDDTTLNAADFDAKIQSGATLLDVRTPEEYASGHISNSINVDFNNQNFEENITMFDKSKTYAVYCASGVRSGKAADLMREKGFTSVYTLDGGIKTWNESKRPLE